MVQSDISKFEAIFFIASIDISTAGKQPSNLTKWYSSSINLPKYNYYFVSSLKFSNISFKLLLNLIRTSIVTLSIFNGALLSPYLKSIPARAIGFLGMYNEKFFTSIKKGLASEIPFFLFKSLDIFTPANWWKSINCIGILSELSCLLKFFLIILTFWF